MSANNIAAHSAGGYNYYIVDTGAKKYIIGGVPERYAEEYIKTAAAADAVVLLTSNPEFSGGVAALLDIMPDMEIYGGSAALRNIKEIINRGVNERLIKDGMTENGLRFFITPGLHWVDSVMVIYDGALFSGQLFSGGVEAEQYFNERLAINRGFVKTALDRLDSERIHTIYPAYGGNAAPDMIEKYRIWAAEPERGKRLAVVIYSSKFGYTRSLAERAAHRLAAACDTLIFDADTADAREVAAAINAADMLAVGTCTEDRNAPKRVWDAICGADLMNRRGRPYFVFGSFGWAGDGIRLIDRTLAAMGMKQVTKPVEVLLKPNEQDFKNIDKAAELMISYEN